MKKNANISTAISQINKALKDKNSTLISIPYYIGFEEISFFYYQKYNKSTLILVESEELLERIETMIKSNELNEKVMFFNRDHKHKEVGNLTLSSIKSFSNNFLSSAIFEKYKSYFDITIIFEANHFVSNSNQDAMQKIKKLSKKILGVTTMVYRSDNISLKSYFDNISYMQTIDDAIKSGALLEYGIEKTESIVDEKVQERVIDDVQRIASKNKDYSLIVYLPSLKMCDETEKILRDRGYAVSTINSKMNTDTKRKIEHYFIKGEYKILLNYAHAIHRQNLNIATDIIIARRIFSPDAIYGILNSLLLKSDIDKRSVLRVYDYYDSVKAFKELDLMSSFYTENIHEANASSVVKRENKKRDTDRKIVNIDIEHSDKDLEMSKIFVENYAAKVGNKYYLSVGFGNKLIEINSAKRELKEHNIDSRFYANIYVYGKEKVKLLLSDPLKKPNSIYDYVDIEELIIKNIDEKDKATLERMLESEISDRQYEILEELKGVDVISDKEINNVSSMQQVSSLISYGFFMAAKSKIKLDISSSKKNKKAVLHADGVASKDVKSIEELIEKFKDGALYVESKRHYVLLLELVKLLDSDMLESNIILEGPSRKIGNFKYKDYTNDDTIDMFLFAVENYLKGVVHEKNKK